jgi:hypothetical protein
VAFFATGDTEDAFTLVGLLAAAPSLRAASVLAVPGGSAVADTATEDPEGASAAWPSRVLSFSQGQT